MDRREVIKYISLLIGGTVAGGTAFIAGCKSETGKPMEWDASEIAYLDEVAETILPQTSTPGAKAAKVGEFMKVMVNDCYEAADQKIFREGMTTLQDVCKKKYGSDFMSVTPEQRKELLIAIDREAKDYAKKVDAFNKSEKEKSMQDPGYKKQSMPSHYFTLMKGLTLSGYFSSEIGMTQALRYLPVPGRYEGCIPYKKGDKAFA